MDDGHDDRAGGPFGALLRRHRLAAGLTQEALAERAGVSARAVSDLERGLYRAPHRDTVARLGSALGLAGEEAAALGAAVERRRGPPTGFTAGRHAAPPGNLPEPLTSFVGRVAELPEVKALVSRARLVTLTGTGGCGKTRLALQAAAELTEAFPDGVWLAELAPLPDEEMLPLAILSALGVHDVGNRPPLTTLVDHLRPKSALLVLDNCEHLVAAAAKTAETLVRQCPRLRVLATSRERLGVAGEVPWRVPSLGAPGPRERPSLGQLLRYEAVQLFVERARVVEPGFTPGERNAPALSEVCSRLDGIPLALELAAARARVLTVEQIAARLDDRFRLLTGGSRTALRRQQTLRATVDWSHDLLSEPERALLRRLSVFAGGWTLEAAEAVCAADPVASEDVLDLLTGLVDKSLVVAEGQDSGERYRLLETIRQYGWGKLQEADEAALLRTRHAEWFMALAVRAEPALSRPDQGPWLERLEQEHDNLRAAIQWSAESGEVEVGLRLGGALFRFWALHGHLREGRERLSALLALPAPGAPSAPPTAARANALRAAGLLASEQGDDAAGRAVLEESLAIWRELGDRPGVAASLNNLGAVVQRQGDYAAARALFEQSLAIKRELDDRQGIASSLHNLGETDHLQGDHSLARDRFEESLAISRELKAELNVAKSLSNLGYLLLDLGDAGAARSRLRESLAILRKLHYHAGIAVALEGLAGVAAAQGAAERAMRLTGAAAALRAPIDVPSPPLERDRLARWLRFARRALSDDATRAMWAEGQAMTPEQATAYALEEAPEQHAVAPTGSVDAADNRPA